MAYFNDNVINIAAALRRKNYLCLGDAIIAATAITGQYTLITNDRDFAKKVEKFIPVISI